MLIDGLPVRYSPLAAYSTTEDDPFITAIRSSLNAFANNLAHQLSNASKVDFAMSLALTLSNSVIVELRELHKLQAAGCDISHLDSFVARHPDSLFALQSDRSYQQRQLRTLASNLVERYLSDADKRNPMVVALGKTVMAEKVFGSIVDTLSNPDWVNAFVIRCYTHRPQHQSPQEVNLAAAINDASAEVVSRGEANNEDINSSGVMGQSISFAEEPSNPVPLQGAGLKRSNTRNRLMKAKSPREIKQLTQDLEREVEELKERRLSRPVSMVDTNGDFMTGIDLPAVNNTISPSQTASFPPLRSRYSLQLHSLLRKQNDLFDDLQAFMEQPQYRAQHWLRFWAQVDTFRQICIPVDESDLNSQVFQQQQEDALNIFKRYFGPEAREIVGVFTDEEISECLVRIFKKSDGAVFVPLQDKIFDAIEERFYIPFAEGRKKAGIIDRDSEADDLYLTPDAQDGNVSPRSANSNESSKSFEEHMLSAFDESIQRVARGEQGELVKETKIERDNSRRSSANSASSLRSDSAFSATTVNNAKSAMMYPSGAAATAAALEAAVGHEDKAGRTSNWRNELQSRLRAEPASADDPGGQKVHSSVKRSSFLPEKSAARQMEAKMMAREPSTSGAEDQGDVTFHAPMLKLGELADEPDQIPDEPIAKASPIIERKHHSRTTSSDTNQSHIVTITDISSASSADTNKMIMTKFNLEYMIAVEANVDEGGGSVIIRRYLDFETLDLGLSKISISKPTLPTYRFRRAGDIASGLQTYLQAILDDPSLRSAVATQTFTTKGDMPSLAHQPQKALRKPSSASSASSVEHTVPSSVDVNKLNEDSYKLSTPPHSISDSVPEIDTSRPPSVYSLQRRISNSSIARTLGASLRMGRSSSDLGKMSESSAEPHSTASSSHVDETASERSVAAVSVDSGVGMMSSDDKDDVDFHNRASDHLEPKAQLALSTEDVDLLLDAAFTVLDEVYDLPGARKNQPWSIRRTVLNVLRGVLRRSYSGVIRNAFLDTIMQNGTEDKMSELIDMVTSRIFPGAAVQAGPLGEEMVAKGSKLREEARAILLQRMIPEALKSTMGRSATEQAVNNVFDCLQDEVVLRGLVCSLITDVAVVVSAA